MPPDSPDEIAEHHAWCVSQGIDPGPHPHLDFRTLSRSLRREILDLSERLEPLGHPVTVYLGVLDLFGIDCPHIWEPWWRVLTGSRVSQLHRCKLCGVRCYPTPAAGRSSPSRNRATT